MKERLNILYQNGQNGLTPAVSASGLLNAVARKWITIEDAVEIIGTDKSAEVIRAAKVAEISAACNAVIVSGIDLELADGPVHFNLSIEDQSNIANLFRVVELGGGGSGRQQQEEDEQSFHGLVLLLNVKIGRHSMFPGQEICEKSIFSSPE